MTEHEALTEIIEKLRAEAESYRMALLIIRDLGIGPQQCAMDGEECMDDLQKCGELADVALKAFVPQIEPCRQVASYSHKCETGIEYIPIELFDKYAMEEMFVDGPYLESFGDGYGEPYNPIRQVYGTLRGDRPVFSVKHSK